MNLIAKNKKIYLNCYLSNIIFVSIVVILVLIDGSLLFAFKQYEGASKIALGFYNIEEPLSYLVSNPKSYFTLSYFNLTNANGAPSVRSLQGYQKLIALNIGTLISLIIIGLGAISQIAINAYYMIVLLKEKAFIGKQIFAIVSYILLLSLFSLFSWGYLGIALLIIVLNLLFGIVIFNLSDKK